MGFSSSYYSLSFPRMANWNSSLATRDYTPDSDISYEDTGPYDHDTNSFLAVPPREAPLEDESQEHGLRMAALSSNRTLAIVAEAEDGQPSRRGQTPVGLGRDTHDSPAVSSTRVPSRATQALSSFRGSI